MSLSPDLALGFPQLCDPCDLHPKNLPEIHRAWGRREAMCTIEDGWGSSLKERAWTMAKEIIVEQSTLSKVMDSDQSDS